jgi:hypothetical protein
VGTDRPVTLGVHNLAAFQDAFRCSTEHLAPDSLFAEGLSATTLFACAVQILHAGESLLALRDA